MSRIHILDSTLADQIAAGEVVERPASVVKELLENAIDAGARNLEISIEQGGTQLMRVADDGEGMDREDAQLCLKRHATSKLRAPEDLMCLATLGFRGEALPSIASVSRLSITTRKAEQVEGTRVHAAGGEPPEVAPVGCAVGTTVEVRDLFFNVPARLKFLKAPATESAHIGETCLRVALAHPALRLTLTRDGRRAKEFLPARGWAERAECIVPERSVPIEGERAAVRVRALLSPPEQARSGAVALYTYVNGRPVKDRRLARAIAFAYGSVLPPGRYPVGVVHLDVAAQEVDVNVHPQKAEVRFQRAREVYDAVTRVLAQQLATTPFGGPAARGAGFWSERLPLGPTSSVQRTTPTELATTPPPQSAQAPSQVPYPDLPRSLPTGVMREPAVFVAPAQAPEPPALFSRSPLRALAQARRLYIVAEGERGLCIVDQHAADERIHYHRLKQQYEARAVPTQRLLVPVRVELSERETALVEAQAEQILATGLEVTPLGATTVAVHAVPALLRRAAPERLLRDLLDQLAHSGERSFGDAIDTALATMACHGAIRGGDALSLTECQHLLDALSRIEHFAGHCPHGRPVVLEIPFDELARKVGR